MFKQEVLIRNVPFKKVIESFHDKDFVRYLIKFQPVEMISWSGIKSGERAEFRFWFFGWREMSVVHKNYVSNKNQLSFEDHGEVLPFGLVEWKHEHIVKQVKDGTLITDLVSFSGESLRINFFIKIIMLFPIIIRRITYKMWFNRSIK
tara:strand:- start:213 stop:656 length:444 start_codon:yes stop_codon:yes gene_type:complete